MSADAAPAVDGLVNGPLQVRSLLYIVRVAAIGGVEQKDNHLLISRKKLETRGLIQRAPAVAGRDGYRWLPTPLGVTVAAELNRKMTENGTAIVWGPHLMHREKVAEDHKRHRLEEET